MVTITETHSRRATVRQRLNSICKLQALESGNHASIIRARIDIGAELIELKSIVPHGKWSQHLGELGYDTRTAERLMAIAKSPLSAKIRSGAPDFAAGLPLDMQALEALARVPTRHLPRAVKRVQNESMNRHQIEVMSRERCGKPPNSSSAKASALRVSASDDDPEDERDADIDSEDEDAEVEFDSGIDEDVDSDDEQDDAEDEDEFADEDQEDDQDDEEAVDEVEDNQESPESFSRKFLGVCAHLMDRLVDETETELNGEDADQTERGQVLIAATQLIKKLRRMLFTLERSEDEE